MSGALPLLLVLVLLLGVAVVLRPVRTAGPATRSEAFGTAERHAHRVTVVAWAVLVPVPVLVAKTTTPHLHGIATGAFLGTVPAVAGTAFLLVHLVGELTWPRPHGAVRRAPLVRRGFRDVAPRALTALTATWTVLLAALLATSAAAAEADGRSLSAVHADGSRSTGGPFPGWYYGQVIAVATAVVVLLCVAVLALVVRRAAVADTDPADDWALRRVSARRVLAGGQLVVAWTLAGCLFFAANCVRGVEPRWTQALGGSAGVALAGLLVALAIPVVAVVVAVGASRTPRLDAPPRLGPAVAAAARPRVS
ncbi:hypothetical protein Cch01nite_02520 [Cellulomonas chitinilytica]|uniref:Uncharacterized protein n=1 Tax=Cellulomonas chitinilytica TaxID=398759 RepID=A0A919P0F0_9CELL|nr:hypothetical protein [Cellulomonas chitinilytica]GIG19528.1 hypothetical protein Cch01nite_02520 [Cellulomonas chitinilytica]